jgi:hypothetical protein
VGVVGDFLVPDYEFRRRIFFGRGVRMGFMAFARIFQGRFGKCYVFGMVF